MPGRARRTALILAVFVCLAVAAATDAPAQGCAMCRTAVEGQDDPLARGLSKSTVFMVSMPFAVVGSIAGWLVLSFRRAKATSSLRDPGGDGNDGGNENDDQGA